MIALDNNRKNYNYTKNSNNEINKNNKNKVLKQLAVKVTRAAQCQPRAQPTAPPPAQECFDDFTFS